MADKELSANDIEIIKQILSELANDADHIADMASLAIVDSGNAEIDHGIQIVAQKMGMFADLAIKRMGGIGCRGGVKEWMYSPRLQELLDAG